MTRLLYDIEDCLDAAATAELLPDWFRRIVASVGRTVGEAGDMVARLHRPT